VAYDWLIHDPDGQHVDDLRLQIGKDSASVLIFLGAGLSVGVGRFLGRASFERPSPWDDDRFPSWPDLIDRMKQELLADSDEATQRSYERFFDHNDYTDLRAAVPQLSRASATSSSSRASSRSRTKMPRA
jgi:hypothetical protein